MKPGPLFQSEWFLSSPDFVYLAPSHFCTQYNMQYILEQYRLSGRRLVVCAAGIVN